MHEPTERDKAASPFAFQYNKPAVELQPQIVKVVQAIGQQVLQQQSAWEDQHGNHDAAVMVLDLLARLYVGTIMGQTQRINPESVKEFITLNLEAVVMWFMAALNGAVSGAVITTDGVESSENYPGLFRPNAN